MLRVSVPLRARFLALPDIRTFRLAAENPRLRDILSAAAITYAACSARFFFVMRVAGPAMLIAATTAPV